MQTTGKSAFCLLSSEFPHVATQTLTYLKQRFEQVGLKLNSRHGQNFLIDLNLVRRDCRHRAAFA